MPVSALEAKLYALLLLKFEMDEAVWAAERGSELEQFLARFMGDGLKMAKCLLQDRATYVELRRMLVLHGGESAPVPISAAQVRLLAWQQMFTC